MGYRKLNNGRSNVTGDNILKFREEKHLTQEQVCAEFQVRGYSFYENDLYKIENAKRLVKDWELIIFKEIFKKDSIDDFYANTNKFLNKK